MTKIQNCSASSYKKPRWLHLACFLTALGGFAGVSGNAMADIQVVSTFQTAAVIGKSCSGGSTLVSGGLTWSCPLTKAEADAAGITYQSTYDELGKTWVRMNWTTANGYCTGQGYRMATRDELVALYNAHPSNQMNTVLGWPVNNYYWSSTLYSAGSHYDVGLSNGDVYGYGDSYTDYVTCVR